MAHPDVLRGITAPVTVQALHAGADALEERPRLLATIAGLEATRDELAAQLAEARRQLEHQPTEPAPTPTPTPEPTPQPLPADALYVAPGGSDTNPGTHTQPFATFGKALTQAGRTVYARGGTYAKDETVTPARGVTLRAYPGEQPKHVGKFWIGTGHDWTIDGIAFTWGGKLTASDHMVKITGGTGWRLLNSEIWGAQSWANLLVAGSVDRWEIGHCHIHDVIGSATHNGVQDHNIYLNAATSTTATGRIHHCLFHGAPRGNNLKVDGTGGTSGGGMGVEIDHNTFAQSRRGALTGGTSNRCDWHHNVFVGPFPDAVMYVYAPQPGFADNRWHDNVVHRNGGGGYTGSHAGFVRSPDVIGDPQLDASHRPRAAIAAGFGHTAA